MSLKNDRSGAPGPRMPEDPDIDDPVVARFLPILQNGHLANNPLFKDLSLLFQKYVRLAKRMNRIAKISDSYQSQLQELKAELEHASQTDFLTGLFNRRTMYSYLEMEMSRAQRHGKTFSIIMADLDHFKKINDTYGHDIGDQVLVAAARVFLSSIRKEDNCARWGGEEFLVLLPETGADPAARVAEKLRARIAELSINAGDRTICPTVSVGVAVFQSGESIDDCIKRADEGLYQAKSSGRNRVVAVAASPDQSD